MVAVRAVLVAAVMASGIAGRRDRPTSGDAIAFGAGKRHFSFATLLLSYNIFFFK